MKNKKSMLLREVVTVVISLLCLVVLFILAYNLYGMFIKKTAFEQAKANLDQITAIISKLGNGDNGDFLLTSPKNWFIISYNKGLASPLSCSLKDCLCICSTDSIEGCNSEGACSGISLSIEQKPSMKITSFLNLKLTRTGNLLSINIENTGK